MEYRNRTLDIAKGIGIILVVLGHNWMVSHGDREIFRVIFSFHMPLFLFLSGIFLNEKSPLKEFSMARVHSLLKPYFATLLFLGLVKLASDVINHRDFLSHTTTYAEGVFYATGRTIAWPPLWYLPHLFVVVCTSLLILKLIASNRIRWLFLVASLSAGIFLLQPRDLPWSIDLLPISLSFLMLGYLCRNLVKQMEFKATYFFCGLALFSVCHFFFNDTIDLNFRIYDSFIISTTQALLGIYLSLSLASFLANYVLAAKVLGYIGSGTLFILLFHSYVQDKVFGLLVKPMGESLLNGQCSLVAGVALPLFLWECFRKSSYLSALFLPKVAMARVIPDGRN